MEKKLQEINHLAAVSASKALSKLASSDVTVKLNMAEVQKIEDIKPPIGAEDVVAGVYLPVTGDVGGAVLLVLPMETAFALCDLVVKRPLGTTRKLTELDESALMEAANIVSGNYLTVLANTLHIRAIEHTPNFSFDIFGAIVNQVITEFAQKTDLALVIEVEFIFKPETLKGYFLVLFEIEQFKTIFDSLGCDMSLPAK